MSPLKEFLDRVQVQFHRAEFLYSDPLGEVHPFKDPRDQEVVSLLSAVLAYGNVRQIRRSIRDALDRIASLAPSPAEFIFNLRSARPFEKSMQAFRGYVHRFNTGADLVLLFKLLSESWNAYDSLGAHFNSFLKAEDLDFGNALSQLIQDWRQEMGRKNKGSFTYLLTSPSDGSCCKRWCMFLRWMGRQDELDLGLWTQDSPLALSAKPPFVLKPGHLVMPLDTHTGRISRYLGLTQRKTLDWKAALEVTGNLKKLDPQDPIRYDFALSRLGILDLCQHTYREEVCTKCQLLPVCQFAQKSVKVGR